jgi:hypothetical protein
MATDSPALSARGRAAFAPLFPTGTAAAAWRNPRWGWWAAGLAVLLGTVVSLLRTAGTGPLQSIWEEDARDILEDALTMSGTRTLVRPIAGYYVLVPRLLGQVAAFFPITWAAAVLSVSAAILTALLAVQVYVASGAHFDNRLARLLVSAPMLFAPVAENWLSEIYNRPVCLHFFAVYAVFWVLLWSPATRRGQAGLLATVGLTAFSTILIVIFLPLAALRAYTRRDRLSLAALGLVLAGTAVQVGSLLLGETDRSGLGNASPMGALRDYVVWGVPNSFLGFAGTSGLAGLPADVWGTVRANAVVIILAWLVLLAVVVAAIVGGRSGWLRPNWRLAGLAAVHSVVLMVTLTVANGLIAQRYLLPVELLLFTTVVALLVPVPSADWRKAMAPLAAFALLVAVVSAFNYRWNNTYRAQAPVWTDQIAQVVARCQADPLLGHVVVRGGPQPFQSTVAIPCHEVRGLFICHSPECVYLDPPRAWLPGQRSIVGGPAR